MVPRSPLAGISKEIVSFSNYWYSMISTKGGVPPGHFTTSASHVNTSICCIRSNVTLIRINVLNKIKKMDLTISGAVTVA
jgi:hypothetical protein